MSENKNTGQDGDIEFFANQQEQLGEVICTIVRNYNKDSPNRKTLDYLNKIKEKLECQWENFDRRDTEIRDKCSDQLQHPYFTRDYYESVRKAVERMRIDVVRRIQEIKDQDDSHKEFVPARFSVQGETHKEDKTSIESSVGMDDSTTSEVPFKPIGKAQELGAIPKSKMGIYTEPTPPGQQQPTTPKAYMSNKQRFGLLINILKRSLNKSIEEASRQRSDQFCQIRARGIEQNWEEITCLYRKLEDETTADDVEDYFDLQERVEVTLLNLYAGTSKFQEKSSETKQLNIMMKLPKIELPKFDGEYLNWLQFHDLFKQMIHDQPIPPAQKLYFLRANVTGKALELIQNFKPTDSNYEVAWNVLVERFNNKRLLLTAQLNKLLVQPVTTATSSSLRRLHDNTKECLQVITNLNVDTASWDPIVVHLLLQKLDRESREQFEFSMSDPRSSPTIEEFLKFVESRFQTLEAISSRDDRRKFQSLEAISSHDDGKKPTRGVASKFGQDPSPICNYCSSSKHAIYNCTKFLSLSDVDRGKAVQRLTLCRNCLKKGHFSQSCQSRRCQKCNMSHNTLLHQQRRQQELPQPQQSFDNSSTHQWGEKGKVNKVPQPQKPSVNNAATEIITKKRHVHLATAVVNVISSYGTRIPCRALLDSGSQLHFVTTSFLHQLGIKKRRMDTPISGIGAQECKSEFVASISFESRASSFKATIEANVMSRISDYQFSGEIDLSQWELPTEIQLADPSFFKANHQIDMLLGAELFFDLLQPGEYRLSNDLPILRNTTLGWIVAGSAPAPNTTAHCHIATKPSLSSLDKLVRSFWETESHETPINTVSEEEHQCEKHFKENTTLNSKGKFVVKLPFKEDPRIMLGDSLHMARRRFLSLENKLSKDDKLKESYIIFMEEYKALGHMTLISKDEIPEPHYVIPHHCVMKAESSSTKLRVVFDASAKTTSGHSLNDILMVGPTVQPDLFSIVLKFRTHKYVFTGDIAKMYRQVLVSQEDRPFQLIFWRSNPDNPLQMYQLNTVTYGTASASYLATRCLVKLAEDNEEVFHRSAEVIKNNVYVDDCLAGSETIEDAQALLKEIICLLKAGNFELKKFCSNNSMILEGISPEDREKLVTFHHSEVIRTLGLIWDPSQDVFKFSFNEEKIIKLNTQISKRTVLADLARLFDPLGLVGPVIVLGKLFLQELWKTKLAWDDILPIEQAQKWVNYLDQFSNMNKISIPRYVLRPSARIIELHAFSDSSLSAYGSCVYLKSTDERNQSFCQLLCSKSRVGPLKTVSIARLELQAAVLMVELVERIIQILPKKIDKVCFYTDSTTVLAWLKSPSYTWETYVANRVAKIQSASEIHQWQYIKGDLNPADLVSRGSSLEALLTSSIWFEGPKFLGDGENIWAKKYTLPDAIPERRKKKSVLTTAIQGDPNFFGKIKHRNSFFTLTKIFSFCFRFVNNSRKPRVLRNTGQLTVEELEEGTRWLLVYTQRVSFPEDYRALEENKSVSRKSNISSLSPYFDARTKLIRVGGRLANATILPDAKHQILIPKNNIITKMILTHLHQKYMHASHRALVSLSRQQYWILGVGNAARQVIIKCIKCFRSKPKSINQLMGNMPPERVTPARPFYHTGVDFCGPIKTHFKVRGKIPTKSYLAVFVCFSTKAVHIEVVGDLSSEAFIYALKRFIGRRGLCHTIFCDNATNFVGAKNELSELTKIFNSERLQSTIHSTCLEDGIKWKNIPPRSPHFGGLWEAAVKSAKILLVRHLGEASLTYEQLLTVVIQIEAILNSRPLTPISSDPNDFEALTPGHFLIGSPLTALAEPDVTECRMSSLNKFRQIQQIQQHFWKRWSTEYLHLLQQRDKWKTESDNLKPDTLVLIKDANTPPMRWKLGRVVEIFKGSDNKVRVANVKTQNGTYQRAIHNLCPLPMDEPDKPKEVPTSIVQRNMRNLRPRKPKKVSLLSAVLLVLLLIPASLCQTPKEVNVKELDDGVGIYFEDIGRVRTVSTYWKIFIYYNMSTYWQEFGGLKSYISRMEEICTKNLPQQNYYVPIIETLRNRIAVIDHNNELLHNYHAPKYERTRAARSPFDIVGTLAHSLFGILDQENADKIQHQIDNAYKNEKHLNELIRKQSSVADATLNILKRNHIQIQDQFKTLNDYLSKTIGIINEKQKANEAIQNLASMTSYLILVLTNFEHVQEILLDVLLDLNHAKINPQLITPKQFNKQLRLVRNNLPSYLSLPEGSVIDMYKMSSVRGRSLNHSIVFEMLLPLTDTEEFQLFNLITVPIIHRNKTYIVEKSASYLAVSLARDRYFLVNEPEMISCKSLLPTKYMCSQVHPTLIQQGNPDNCEMALLNHNQGSLNECTLKTTPIQNHWKRLKASNSWIFSITSKVSGHLICSGKSNAITLSGNGLLEFNKACVLQLPDIVIKGRIEFETNITSSFIPSANVSSWIIKQDAITTTPKLPIEVHIDPSEFDNMKRKIEDVIAQSKDLPAPTDLNSHDYYHYGISAFMFAGMIGILITLRYRTKRPTPKPRRSASRFEVNV